MLMVGGPIYLAAIVIAGFDPAIHFLSKKMDARVKPGHDADRIAFVPDDLGR
jgi:hypothetical protein